MGGTSSGGGTETGVFVGTTAAHNTERATVGSPSLTWSNGLAAYAQNWADTIAADCVMRHSGGRYGENIAAFGSSAGPPLSSPQKVVDYWSSEKSCWTYGTIEGTEQCNASCVAQLSSNGCGHYTQVVWKNTQRVGCGRSTCKSGNWEFWVCSYDPPGNIVGQTPY